MEVDPLSIFFVIGESTPAFCVMAVSGAVFMIYFLRRLGFSMMSLAATGAHPSFTRISSP